MPLTDVYFDDNRLIISRKRMPEAQQQAVINNRRRMQHAYGKRLQRRRSWLRGIDEVRKRHLKTAMAHNLGLVLRKLLGTGKVRQFGSRCARVFERYCGEIYRFSRLGSSD